MASLAPAQSSSNTRKPRLRTALCAYSFRKELDPKSRTMTYEDLVHLAVDLEVDGLDLTVYWLDTSDASLLSLRRTAFKNAVEIYSISVRTDLCKPEGAERDQQLADLRKWVDVAEKLGAGHIRVFGGNVPKGATEQQAAGWVTENLKVASGYSGSKGVILGLENHGGITEKAETILSIVKNVNSPWVGINMDTGNFNRNAYEQIAMCLPYAVNAQYKVLIKPGAEGKAVPADWPRLVRMFADSGYKGYFALEYEEKEPAPTAVPRLTRELNAIVAKTRA